QVEHLVNRAAAVANLQHLRLEALAVALVARNEHVRQKLHLDADLALALAGLASAPRDVERKVTRGQAAGARIFGRREQLPNRIEGLQVGDGVRARRSTDGSLIDEHGVGDELRALD